MIDKEIFENLGCYGLARIILDQNGGKNNGRIYQVFCSEYEQKPDKETSHAYVVLNNANPNDPALNNYKIPPLTNKEVLETGTDVTEEIYGYEWSEL